MSADLTKNLGSILVKMFGLRTVWGPVSSGGATLYQLLKRPVKRTPRAAENYLFSSHFSGIIILFF
jgi:hypothetical protein